MSTLFIGENVKHNKKKEWGIGKVIKVDRCGTIRVVFGTQVLSFAKGVKHLTKVDESGKKIADAR